jgi:hypothetical protein
MGVLREVPEQLTLKRRLIEHQLPDPKITFVV